jgi:lactobin A/cerein 7B family class IIb bacteriocin
MAHLDDQPARGEQAKARWRLEMNTQTSEIRSLSDAELDQVEGGFLPALAVGAWLAAGFVWGMVAGQEIHRAYYE